MKLVTVSLLLFVFSSYAVNPLYYQNYQTREETEFSSVCELEKLQEDLEKNFEEICSED